MSEFKNVSIMLGAVTETDTLRDTVLTVLDLCDHKDLAEFLIAHSQHATAETLAVCKELESMQSDVPVVVFEQVTPKMGSIAECMDKGTGSHQILLSSDMATDLDIVPKMIEHAKKEPETIVTVSRWLPGCKFEDYSKVREVLNFLAQIYLRALYQTKMTDMTNPIQIAPAELYKSIKWESTGFPMLLEMVLKPLRLGYKFVEIPTNCYGRKQGKSSNSFTQTAAYLKTSLHIRFMKKSDMLKENSPLWKKFNK